jgi:hypothetical protein
MVIGPYCDHLQPFAEELLNFDALVIVKFDTTIVSRDIGLKGFYHEVFYKFFDGLPDQLSIHS